jgi:hypothetical protein
MFPSVDTVGVKIAMSLDALMERPGDDVAFALFEQIAAAIARPALRTAQEMDDSAALVTISLRGVRETLLRLADVSAAVASFDVVFPCVQRKSCPCSIASAVEAAPPYVMLRGSTPLYNDEALRSWSQRLWALLRMQSDRRDDAGDAAPCEEPPVLFDMFALEKDCLRL